MVPLDGSALAEQALPVAELLARTVGGRIDLMSVTSGRTEATTSRRVRAPRSRPISTGWPRRCGSAACRPGSALRSGHIPEEIGRHGIESNADVIVMATHGLSRVDRLLGRNIATAVVRQTELPVLIVRPTDVWTSRHTAFRRLLVSLDGSVDSEEVLPSARVIARSFRQHHRAPRRAGDRGRSAAAPGVSRVGRGRARGHRHHGGDPRDGVGCQPHHHQRGGIRGVRSHHDGDARARRAGRDRH